MQNFFDAILENPFRYLRIPIHHTKILNSDWKAVEERFEKGFNSWNAKHVSYSGRLILINSVLSSLPMFIISFFRITKGVITKLD